MRHKSFSILAVVLLGMACFFSLSLRAQVSSTYPLRLQWDGVVEEKNDYGTMSYIALESAEYVGEMPVFCQSFPIYDNHVKAKVGLNKVVTAPLSQEEMHLAESFTVASDFEVIATPLRSRDESLLSVRIVPFRQAYFRLL